MNRRTILLAAAATATSCAAIAQPNQGPAPTPVQSSALPRMSDTEQAYASRTAMIGGASLQMADLALRKARHARVREFARFEHDEQTTVSDVLKSMDSTLNQPSPPSDVAAALEKLRRAGPGAAFDREFVTAQIQGHEKLKTIQEDYLKSGQSQPFVNTAKLVLAVINEHLALLNDLRSEHMTAL